LDGVNLTVKKGEIFALLGPNGAGKTTLINTVCGLVRPTAGSVMVGGFDIVKDYRQTRSLIGLVPQELTSNAFEKVWDTVTFSRGLFGKPPNPQHIESVLKALSLWEKRRNRMMTLSGGMKRRVLIAKALAHEPKVLFLDEPTAGVDVELRKDMWKQVALLRESGVTIILTTHYIEEAEQMADRVGVINQGKIILVDDKSSLVKKMGRKEVTLFLQEPLIAIPDNLKPYNLKIDGLQCTFNYDTYSSERTIQDLFSELRQSNINFSDIQTRQSSLEDIFVQLVKS
jgi:ABC-2 type transport system ATP-binding protein